ncbi:MAG: DNA helicase, partial [Proteobacteria bacterium]|nr:DNA helicase [Pseudomonadota bacterium]
MSDFQETSRIALAHAPTLLAKWLPGGKLQGPEYISTNPTRSDRQPGSFKTNTLTGKWGDFATGEAGGDLISLRAYLEGVSQVEALKLVADEVGATPVPKAPMPQPEQHPVLPIPGDAPKAQPHPRLGKPDNTWCYKDEKGQRLFFVCRFPLEDGGKAILPLTYWPDGWRWKALPAPRPLYGLDRLTAKLDATVLVVEGEKAADAAQKLFPGVVAVASPGGSKAASKADWEPLKGRDVVIWPDHDQPG